MRPFRAGPVGGVQSAVIVVRSVRCGKGREGAAIRSFQYVPVTRVAGCQERFSKGHESWVGDRGELHPKAFIENQNELEGP